MIITDLDGTIHIPEVGIPPTNLETLEELGTSGVVRVLATGRSLWGVRQLLPGKVPFDYLVFASGAGILDWNTGQLVFARNFTPHETALGSRALIEEDLSFMMLRPVPESHLFHYYLSSTVSSDFQRRLTKYSSLATKINGASPERASQFLVIVDASEAERVHALLRTRLSGFSIVKATSPIDHESFWFEVFADGVSKAGASSFIANQHGIKSEHCLAVGNDYNDETLLRWAGKGFVVKHSPTSLRDAFIDCGDARDGALASALRIWNS